MTVDEKLNEALTLIRMLDTKIGFLEEDIGELKAMVAALGETSTVMFARLSNAVDSIPASNNNNNDNNGNKGNDPRYQVERF